VTALVDARFKVHRIGTRGDRLQAFADDGLRQHGCGGGAPASSDVLEATSFHHLSAHVLELVFQLDSLATDTPSLVTVGAPKLLFEHGIAALGPSVTLTAFARNIYRAA